VAIAQRGQQKQIRELLRMLHDWKNSDFVRLPAALRGEIELARAQEAGDRTVSRRAQRGPENRCIADYVCTLTDEQCAHLYQLLSGAASPSLARAFAG